MRSKFGRCSYQNKKLDIFIFIFFNFNYIFFLKYFSHWYSTRSWLSNNTNFIKFFQVFDNWKFEKLAQWIKNHILCCIIDKLYKNIKIKEFFAVFSRHFYFLTADVLHSTCRQISRFIKKFSKLKIISFVTELTNLQI